MKLTLIFVLVGTLAVSPLAAEKKVKLESLPAAVQAAVKEQTQGATLVGVSKEKEKGKTVYEIEMKVGGKTRDLTVDAAGQIVLDEVEVEISTIPAAAREAIEKKAASGKIKLVEKITQAGSVRYEAQVEKGRKTSEFTVNADGTVYK
jgi:uncharacterized membrane protein YkoI